MIIEKLLFRIFIIFRIQKFFKWIKNRIHSLIYEMSL